MTRADLTKNPADVSTMFDGVAGRYDLLNTVLAFGQDRGWRSAMVEALDLPKGSEAPVPRARRSRVRVTGFSRLIFRLA